jgi:hypothetical protein
MHIGICNNAGLVYEGLGAADIPTLPLIKSSTDSARKAV